MSDIHVELKAWGDDMANSNRGYGGIEGKVECNLRFRDALPVTKMMSI